MLCYGFRVLSLVIMHSNLCIIDRVIFSNEDQVRVCHVIAELAQTLKPGRALSIFHSSSLLVLCAVLHFLTPNCCTCYLVTDFLERERVSPQKRWCRNYTVVFDRIVIASGTGDHWSPMHVLVNVQRTYELC